MKKRYNISILILSLIFSGSFTLFAQEFKSTGKIHNKGTIIIKGQAEIQQDTLGGKVKYDMDKKDVNQYIEQITYEDLEFTGISNKIMQQQRNLVVLKRFQTAKNLQVRISDENTLVESRGTTIHDAIINPAFNHGRVLMNGTVPQDIWGEGNFKELELFNPAGADVRNGGGFKISKALILSEGEFRNDSDNNFVMGDSSEIVRYAAGSLQSSPEAENEYSVRYEGGSAMLTTGEIPNEDVLRDMAVNNAGGIELAKNAEVNRDLHVGASIYTTGDTLTFDSQNTPTFAAGNPSAEVVGSMKRTNIAPGRDYILNNPYTKARFGTAENLNGTSAVISTIYPDTVYTGPQSGELVRRKVKFEGVDAQGNLITGEVRVHFAYGWRHKPGDDDVDETGDLTFDEIGLKRWTGDSWETVISAEPQLDADGNWGYGFADSLTRYGRLALGSGASYVAPIEIMAYLEGAFMPGTGGRMHTKLKNKGLLDNLPDENSYPVNLIENYDPDGQTLVPDSVVDYIVIEFREERNSEGFFKLGFIRKDGTVVDLAGNEVISVEDESELDLEKDYYVALRHRNHQPVISADRYNFGEESTFPVMSFNKPGFVEGGTATLKLVEVLDIPGIGEVQYYAIKAGFFADEESMEDLLDITKNFTLTSDHEKTYNLFVKEGYLPADYDLNGVITTRDFNFSWNNRLNK